MPRYIDADALKLPSELPVDPYDDPYFRGMYSGWNNAIRECKDLIDSAPTISPDEVRGVGKWDRVETEFGLRCPKCGKLLDEYVNGGEWVALSEIPNYCPNCGARLTGGEND